MALRQDVCVVVLLLLLVKYFHGSFAVAEVVFTGGRCIGIFLYNAALGGCALEVEQDCQILKHGLPHRSVIYGYGV